MSMVELESALNQGFSDGAFFDTADWFVGNFEEDTPNDGVWTQTFFLPAQPIPTGLGREGTDTVTGIYQIDLNYPLNQGRQNIIAKYEEIRTYFWAGRKFTSGTTSLAIRSAGSSPGSRVNQNYRISVSVEFEARISRS
jgi:hypothetical protein